MLININKSKNKETKWSKFWAWTFQLTAFSSSVRVEAIKPRVK